MKGPATAIALSGLLIGSGIQLYAQDLIKAKQELAKHGITITSVYGGTIFANVSGGIRRGGTYTGNVNLDLTVDGERLLGRHGLTLFADGLFVHGGEPSSLAGDAQGVNNLSAPQAITLYEAWVQYNVFGDRMSLLSGRYDLNTEFYRVASAGLFLNSSFGVGPEFSQSGAGGPSIFPNTSVGVRLGLKPTANSIVRVAVLDGAPFDRPDGSHGAFRAGDGLLLVSEAAFLSRPTTTDRPTRTRTRIGRASGLPPYDRKIAVGAWHYTATFDDLSQAASNGAPVQHHGSGGGYVLGDAVLARSQTDRTRRLAGFVEAGLGDGRVDRFAAYLGTGLVATGPFSGRPTDEVGFAVAIARNGSAYSSGRRALAMISDKSETALEITYLAQVASWLAIQPDVQYVIHPNTDPTLRNAFAVQLRFETMF